MVNWKQTPYEQNKGKNRRDNGEYSEEVKIVGN